MTSFAFNASALAVGGLLTRDRGNTTTVIPSVASVVLAPTGGEGRARVEGYADPSGLSFSLAESIVVGKQLTENVYSTSSTVRIENLSLFGKLKIALMKATVTSQRDLDNPSQDESLFTVSALYEGVVVGEQGVTPTIDSRLCCTQTFEEFAATVTDAAAIDEYAERFGHTPDSLRLAVANCAVPVRGSLTSEVVLASPERHPVPRPAQAIEVPGVGRVFLAEFLFKPSHRRVNLLRIDVDTGLMPSIGPFATRSLRQENPEGGTMTFGSVEGNGSPIDP